MTLASYGGRMSKTYHAYMLRVWTVGEGESVIWRASLEDPHSGAQRAFASLELLMGFLQEMVRAQSAPTLLSNPLDAPPAVEKR